MRPLLVLCLALCAFAAPAGAAGPPLPSGVSGSEGVAAPGGGVRYFTARAGTQTIVRAERGGRTVRSARIDGHWAVPAVTIEGATTGLSADGSTLVLARVARSYPPPESGLIVLDAESLKVRREISLRDFATVDAVSPDGRWAYLIQYDHPDDPLDYRVRALDTGTGRFAPSDVVDPRNPDEQMGGLPMVRLMSPDGRWAYTLYGGGDEVFIHALDTVGRTAACIDLEMLPTQGDLSGYTLRFAGDRLQVASRDGVVANVNRRTLAVSEPGAAPAAPAREPAPKPTPAEDGFPWALVAGIAAAALALAVLVARLRGRARPQLS